MTITAKLLKAEEKSTYWKMKVEYDDDGEIVEDTFRFQGSTPQSLKQYVSSKVDRHEEVKSFDFSTLIGTVIDVTPDPVTPPEPPTAEEIAKAQWFADYDKLRRVQLLLEAAPALATAGRIQYRDGLQSDVESNWLDSYLGDL
jgi:hypothetical protein